MARLKNNDLTTLDYNELQVEAAKRVLIELGTLLTPHINEYRVVGGWVPDLLFKGRGHIGSIDVDVLIIIQNMQMTDIKQ